MMYYLRQFLATLLFPVRALLSSPRKLFSSSQRLFGISLPARVAVLVWFFLIVCVVISAIAYLSNPESAFFQAFASLRFKVVTTILVIVIPLLVYHVLRLWLEGDVSPFEDIRLAWKEGIAELERQGLDITRIPVFLVLGSGAEPRERALFDAARLSLNIRECPAGPRALHWYANPDAIYLVASDVGSLSRLARMWEDSRQVERSRAEMGPAVSGGRSIVKTIVAGTSAARPQEDLTSSRPITRTAAEHPPAGGIRGTMEGPLRMKGEDTDEMLISPGAADSSRRPVKLPPDEASVQARRLEYLCGLVRAARQPVCPVNGLLTLLPYDLITRGPGEGVEVQKALQRDIRTAHQVLKIRCPATAMVIGMEEDDGFRELVRRLGRDRAVYQRFGKGFSLNNLPIPERLEALTAHACGAFEAWIYDLFRDKEALSRPGNKKLYALLCNIRRNVQMRLGNILVAGFGSDPDTGGEPEPFLFGGCYFAAAGDREDRQAFVRAVFDKLPEQQGELQWTRAALGEDDKYRRLAWAMVVYDVALVAALVVMFVVRLWPSS